ncbi:MAG: LysM peptidoglycan-binding domain-containing protein [Candidatus Limnocylindria bacterium]
MEAAASLADKPVSSKLLTVSKRSARSDGGRARQPSRTKEDAARAVTATPPKAAAAHGRKPRTRPSRALLESVWPSLLKEEQPRWARRNRRPIPKTVRIANALTEGAIFTVVLVTLLTAGITVGAWAIGRSIQDSDGDGVAPPIAAPTSDVGSSQGVASSPSPKATVTAPPARERRYVVRQGDTLTAIAQQVYGDASLSTLILDANRDQITDPDNLLIGTSLLIPDR